MKNLMLAIYKKIILTGKIKKLRAYFEKEPNVALAFLFGSQAQGRSRQTSDWDIAVYFESKEYAELETNGTYSKEDKVWGDVAKILKTDVDFLVLNRAKPSLVFSILNSGIPIIIKNRKLYTELLSRTHYEAVDFWNFVSDFWRIRERSSSLSPQDTSTLIEHLVFLENEFKDIDHFRDMTWKEYSEDRDKRRNLERWVENLVMASLDIAKIILASEKREVPQTYRESLRSVSELYFDSQFAEQFSKFTDLRNIITHEYLDLRWDRIKQFIREADRLFPQFIAKIKEVVGK